MTLDSVFIGLFLLALVFPVAYVFARELDNKVLFLFAAYGAEAVITGLLVGAATPLIALTLFTVPTLTENSPQFEWIWPLARFVSDYWLLVTSLITFVSPILIHRRYRSYFEAIPD